MLTGFSNGTALKLEALGTSGIAWSSFENIHIQDAKKGIHIEVAADGSFINLLTFRSITIAGEGYEYGVLIDGPLSTTDWYGIALQAACPTKGHLVLNTNGAVNMYGVDITSSETTCNDQTLLIHLSETTRGSYIHGRAGKGSIIDLGSNFIDLAGASSLGAVSYTHLTLPTKA